MQVKRNKVANRFRNCLCLIFFLFFLQLHSQKRDTVAPDTLKIYKKIKLFAYKYGVTRWAYKYIFVDPVPAEYPKTPVVPHEEAKIVNPYLKYRGKIIRKVNIAVYDPFGHSLTDTCCRRLNYVQKAGNSMHLKTREWVIRNRLLFKEKDTLNPITLSETERLMRDVVYVNDAKVFVTKTGSKDSVDVNVLVIDKWAITLPFLVTDISASGRLRNYNFMGLGQQFQQYARFVRPDKWEFEGSYNIANIDNTFISSQIGYQTNLNQTSAYINFDKPFYSPLVKWAWGAGFNHQWKSFAYTDSIDSVGRKAPVDVLNYDLWTQRAFKLTDDKTFFNQSTNILVGLRHYNSLFIKRPSDQIDKNHAMNRTMAGLGNIGFAVQQYYKDRYIYRFGANEDVPEGLIMQFIYGALKPEFSKVRYYVGAEIARAKHFKIGYFNATLAHGVFFNQNVSNDITTNFNLSYFSNLARNGRWLFRQFVNYRIVHGENKIDHSTLGLSSDEMYGFQGQTLSGNTKMVLNSETVAYAPYLIAGFRFAPVMQIGMAMMGDPEHRVMQSRLYQAYALGLMLRNENLLVSTFQFSIGMYPFFPDDGNNKWIYNPVTSFTLKVRAFSVSRPDFVGYY